MAYSFYVVSNSDRPVLSSRIYEHLRAYCASHGYALHLGDKNECPDRHISWSKIPLLLDAIEQNQHDYYVWIDDDILITDKNIPLLTLS